jgi:hypothetical protein
MKIVKIIAMTFVGLAALMCAGASADQPTTRPAGGWYANPRPYASPGLRAMRALVVGKTADIHPATQQEWDDMMNFMETNSPERFHVLSSIPIAHDSPIALEAIRKWRNYLFVSEHFPASIDGGKMAGYLVRRFQREDELFDLTEKYRADEGTDAIELQGKIRDKAAEIFQLELNIRQARIDRLQELLAKEKTNFVAIQSSEDEIVDKRTALIIKKLEKRNPNLAPPTTRPEDIGSTDEVSPSASHEHDALMNVSNPADSAAK